MRRWRRRPPRGSGEISRSRRPGLRGCWRPGRAAPSPLAPRPLLTSTPLGGAGADASGVKMEEGAEETLAQQRDRLALALAHGPVRVDSHIKVEDSKSGEDTDGDGEGAKKQAPC
jgi:hypothetical protein